MRFAQPHFIAFFVSIAAAAVFYIWALKARRKAQEQFCRKELLPELLCAVAPGSHLLRAGLLLAGIFFCLLALLRPQWGFHWQEVRHKGLDIVIAVDTSKSMLCQDIKPDRLSRAKLAIRDFIQRLNADRVGLVAFSGSAFQECPLTIDYGGFLMALDALDTAAIPRGGTAISSAIRETMRAFAAQGGKSRVLVLITDGEDHEGSALKLAEEAKKQGIVIHCIGIGTKEGELIFTETSSGAKEFLKDSQGNAVKSRLDEETLQKISLATGGTYIRSTSTEFGLDLLYREKLSGMERNESQSKLNKRYEERFQWFLGIGLLLIVAELFVSELKPKR